MKQNTKQKKKQRTSSGKIKKREINTSVRDDLRWSGFNFFSPDFFFNPKIRVKKTNIMRKSCYENIDFQIW